MDATAIAALDRVKRRNRCYWRNKAISKVGHAKHVGKLACLNGSIPCVDCGQPATCYDHRDYGKPLDVEPVCNACNYRRGPAKFPGCDKPAEELLMEPSPY